MRAKDFRSKMSETPSALGRPCDKAFKREVENFDVVKGGNDLRHPYQLAKVYGNSPHTAPKSGAAA